MFGVGGRPPAVLVVREADEMAAALRRALEEAPEVERPGLARAVEILSGLAGSPEAEVRGRWALARLAAAGYEGPPDAVAAVRALRRAVPALGLAQAVALTKEAAACSSDGTDGT